MLILAQRRAVQSPRPGTFMGLMDLYEHNYMRFRKLCPGIDQIDEHAVSIIDGALDLHLRVLERSPYTLTFLLTYYLQDEARGFTPNPNLRVRVYHDARQAEVLSRTCRRIGAELGVKDLVMEPELLCRWRLNRFLYKWLGYCLHQGHEFGEKEHRAVVTRGGENPLRRLIIKKGS